MWPTKRFILWAIVATTLSFIWNISTVYADSTEETYFITTAYYSPLPGQVKYYNGSYAAEVRMNWEGTHGASGKEVFPGMLAGPANYPLGTKIYFEGYGIAEIADRWGAIVNKGVRGHEYDRIDIWMGYGDEGRERAIAWGTRKIKGKIVVPSADVTLSFDKDELGLGYIGQLKINPEASDPKDVKKLQEFFTRAGIYSGPIDGKFDSIQDALTQFQIDNDVIESSQSEDAGWFGGKTLAAIREKFNTGVGTILSQEDTNAFHAYNHKAASAIYKLILDYGNLQVTPESSPKIVVELQKLLTALWEYDGPLNGRYSDVVDTLIDFQIRVGLVNHADDWWAGYFGNKTKSALWEYYEDHDIEIIEVDLSRVDLIEVQPVVEKKSENLENSNKSEPEKTPEEAKVEVEEIKTVTLSNGEKARIDRAMKALRDKLKRQETITRKTLESQLESLNTQITDILPSIEDATIRAKLLYIQEVIERGY